MAKGLKVEYTTVYAVRDTIQKLLSLPFILVNDVIHVFVGNIPELDHIIEEKLYDLINYVEVTYVKGRPARGRRAATSPSP